MNARQFALRCTVDDIVSPGGIKAVSHRFREAYRKGKLKGARFVDPVGIVTERDGPRYRETVRRIEAERKIKIMWVQGHGGSIAKTRRLKVLRQCDICGWIEWSVPRNFHVKLDPKQWDGSDFLHVIEYGPVFMTERAVQVLSEAGLTNFGADPAF